jgi:hypothetical protein
VTTIPTKICEQGEAAVFKYMYPDISPEKIDEAVRDFGRFGYVELGRLASEYQFEKQRWLMKRIGVL